MKSLAIRVTQKPFCIAISQDANSAAKMSCSTSDQDVTSRADSGISASQSRARSPVRINAVPVHDENGSIIGAVETLSEKQPATSSDRGDALRQFHDSVDPVTGVANRASKQSHLRRALVSRVEVHIPFSLLLLRVEGLAHFRGESQFGSSVVVPLRRCGDA